MVPGGFFFPQPLVDGFSKLWLRGKGNLRVETLIPAGSRTSFTPGRAHAPKTPIFTRFSAKCPKPTKKLQKQQYLQGFLQKSLKNIKKTQVSAVFARFSAKSIQKPNYLQGFR